MGISISVGQRKYFIVLGFLFRFEAKSYRGGTESLVEAEEEMVGAVSGP